MSALAAALLADMSDDQLRALAERLKPYLATESGAPMGTPTEDPILNVKTMAERLGKSERYVAGLCRDGRLAGAFKPAGTKYWLCRESDFEAAMSGRPARRARRSSA